MIGWKSIYDERIAQQKRMGGSENTVEASSDGSQIIIRQHNLEICQHFVEK